MKLWAKKGFEWAEDGLVGLWSPVNTGATNRLMIDCALHGINTGTNRYANGNLAWSGSSTGTVFECDGTNNNVVDLPNKYAGLSGPFSITTWFLSTYTGTGAPMIASNYNGSGGGHLMYINGSTGFINSFIGASSVEWSGLNVNDGKLHCATVTRINFSTLACFVDGVNLGNKSGTFTGNPGEQGGGTPGQFLAAGFFGVPFKGQIFEINMMQNFMQFGEHQSMYQAGPGGMWQREPRRNRSYFAQITTFKNYWFRQQQHMIGGGIR